MREEQYYRVSSELHMYPYTSAHLYTYAPAHTDTHTKLDTKLMLSTYQIVLSSTNNLDLRKIMIDFHYLLLQDWFYVVIL